MTCEPEHAAEIPCRTCSSEGIVDYRVTGIDYRDGSLIETWQNCPTCGGEGVEIIEGEDVTEDERMEG